MSITKILVLGKTGDGKTTLCNYILNYSKKNVKNLISLAHVLKQLMDISQIHIKIYL